MDVYKNIGGRSGVAAYTCGDVFIKVKFIGSPKTYLYNHLRPGRHHVERMKELALAGHGLQTYINQHRSAGYAGIE